MRFSFVVRVTQLGEYTCICIGKCNGCSLCGPLGSKPCKSAEITQSRSLHIGLTQWIQVIWDMWLWYLLCNGMFKSCTPVKSNCFIANCLDYVILLQWARQGQLDWATLNYETRTGSQCRIEPLYPNNVRVIAETYWGTAVRTRSTNVSQQDC